MTVVLLVWITLQGSGHGVHEPQLIAKLVTKYLGLKRGKN
jgi:hypothetical protein